MLIYWRISYLSQQDKKMKDRALFLDTETLPPAIGQAFLYQVEAENLLRSYSLIPFRKYFIEVPDLNYHLGHGFSETASVKYITGPPDYFESENGDFLSHNSILKLLGKKPPENQIPEYLERFLKSNNETQSEFDEETRRQVQIFSENLTDLSEIPFSMPELQKNGDFFTLLYGNTNIEIEAFVQIFRKLYSHDPQAKGSFGDVCDDLIRYPESSLSLLAEDAKSYFENIKKKDISTFTGGEDFLIAPCISKLFGQFSPTLTVDEFIQIYFYTQFLHNPNCKRRKTLTDLRQYLNRDDADTILNYIFSAILWNFRCLFQNVGQVFCKNIDQQDSPSYKLPNIGSPEPSSEDRKKQDIFNKHKRLLAQFLWEQDGRPPQGPYCYENEAERQLKEQMEVSPSLPRGQS